MTKLNEVTLTKLDVTIHAIRVGNRPMTKLVFSQIPCIDGYYDQNVLGYVEGVVGVDQGGEKYNIWALVVDEGELFKYPMAYVEDGETLIEVLAKEKDCYPTRPRLYVGG